MVLVWFNGMRLSVVVLFHVEGLGLGFAKVSDFVLRTRRRCCRLVDCWSDLIAHRIFPRCSLFPRVSSHNSCTL